MYVKAFIVNVNTCLKQFFCNISILSIESRFKAFGLSVVPIGSTPITICSSPPNVGHHIHLHWRSSVFFLNG